MTGASPAAVQRIMRHSDPRITMGIYGHLTKDYLKAEINRLVFTEPSASPAVARAAENHAPLVASLLQDPSGKPSAPSTPASEGEGFQVLGGERDIGFEPTTFSLGS
jgi:hypothetical protein